MAQRTEELNDLTPLNGVRINVAARIGWLLRVWRMHRGLTLRDLSGLARHDAGPQAVSTATLSRLETSGRRHGVATATYEQACGLGYGALRAPIDVLCRTFDYAPEDVDPFVPAGGLAGFTDSCAAVVDGATGHDWLRLAEFHTGTGFGLPADQLSVLVDRLASEVGRATGVGYQLRYEALAQLRCSAYADVVADGVARAIAVEGMQRPDDLVSAVTELPTEDLLIWCCELLSDPSWQIARAGCAGLHNLRSVGGLDATAWLGCAPLFVAACERAVGDPDREPYLSAALSASPRPFREAVHAQLGRRLPPARQAQAWSRDRLNQHYSFAEDLANRIASERYGAPMLARLLFELLYDFRATHAVTSAFLLSASPFAVEVRHAIHDAVVDGPDDVTRHGAAAAFAKLMLPCDGFDPTPWLASEDSVTRGAAWGVSGFAGDTSAADLFGALGVGAGIGAGDNRAVQGHQVLFGAGMARDARLEHLTRHPDISEGDRLAASWWLTEGGRVLD